MRDFSSTKAELEPLRQKLLDHPIYTAISSKAKLRSFMEAHVFAVWDFMSLAKRLQRDLTCVTVPWTPPATPAAARLINEVVLAEESDIGPDGAPCSHLELYLLAMTEVGANTQTFKAFLRMVSCAACPLEALSKVEAPGFVRTFVTETLGCAERASTIEVAASFLFGREDLIPEMFQRLLPVLFSSDSELTSFVYYLKRHIELDAEDHGPMARRLLEGLAGTSPGRWEEIATAAILALKSRLSLWDGVLSSINASPILV